MKGLLKSFVYAFSGIKYAVFTERNFRIHMTAVFFVTYFSFLYGLEFSQYAILFVVFAAVPALELMNTAIEKTVDLKSEEFNKKAKVAKDSAAGSVLIMSLGAIGVAVSLFSDTEQLNNAIMSVFTLPHLPILTAVAILSIYFIFFFGKKRDK